MRHSFGPVRAKNSKPAVPKLSCLRVALGHTGGEEDYGLQARDLPTQKSFNQKDGFIMTVLGEVLN